MPRFNQYRATDKISVDNFNEMMQYADALANLKVSGGKFTIGRGGAALEVNFRPDAKVYLVKLDEDLPEGSLTAPKTAKARPYFVSELQEDLPPVIQASDTQQIVVVNRHDTFSAKSQDNLLVIRVDVDSRLEWQPISGDNTIVIDKPQLVGCSCDYCVPGYVIQGATECCSIPLAWSMGNPWLTCATGTLDVQYYPDDKLISEVFKGPGDDDNEYRYVVEISVTGLSYVILEIVTDNGGATPCLIYGKEGFDCLCSNLFTIDRPYGKVKGIKRKDISCTVCLLPKAARLKPACGFDNAPEIIQVILKDNTPGAPAVGWLPDSGDIYLIFQDADTHQPITHNTGCDLYDSTPLGCWVAKYQTDTVNTAYGHDTDLLMKASCSSDGQRFDVWIGVIDPLFSGTDAERTIYNFSNYEHTVAGIIRHDFDIRLGIPILYLDSYCDPVNGTGVSEIGKPIASVIPLDPYVAIDSTGACADTDCVTDLAPVRPDGYCCRSPLCLDYVSQTFCSEIEGTWYNTGECPGECDV